MWLTLMKLNIQWIKSGSCTRNVGGRHTVMIGLSVLALASVDALPTAACAKIDILIGECRLNQDVPPQPCEGCC